MRLASFSPTTIQAPSQSAKISSHSHQRKHAIIAIDNMYVFEEYTRNLTHKREHTIPMFIRAYRFRPFYHYLLHPEPHLKKNDPDHVLKNESRPGMSPPRTRAKLIPSANESLQQVSL